uniref:Uncharacterized protein n=1 Tax=Plectus sambesii TaxID=2011161 RepID=A0A914UTP8_9BILA
MGCPGITPGGIRAFIEKWLKKERPQVDANTNSFGWPLGFCELTFYKCANVTPVTVEEMCGDLLRKETTEVYSGKYRVKFIILCHSSRRALEICFDSDSYGARLYEDPRMSYVVDGDDDEDDDDDDDDDDDEDEDEDDIDVDNNDEFDPNN